MLSLTHASFYIELFRDSRVPEFISRDCTEREDASPRAVLSYGPRVTRHGGTIGQSPCFLKQQAINEGEAATEIRPKECIDQKLEDPWFGKRRTFSQTTIEARSCRGNDWLPIARFFEVGPLAGNGMYPSFAAVGKLGQTCGRAQGAKVVTEEVEVASWIGRLISLQVTGCR